MRRSTFLFYIHRLHKKCFYDCYILQLLHKLVENARHVQTYDSKF